MHESAFHFTITDAARFLGKSPVTLRKWEREGLISYPRLDGSRDRRFDLAALRELVNTVRALGRISIDREQFILSSITLLELIERENRNPRSPRGR